MHRLFSLKGRRAFLKETGNAFLIIVCITASTLKLGFQIELLCQPVIE